MRKSGSIVIAAALSMALASCASTTETAFAVPPDCQRSTTAQPGSSPWPVPSERELSQDCLHRINSSRSDAPPR